MTTIISQACSFKIVTSRSVYNSAHFQKTDTETVILKAKSGTGGATNVFINILRDRAEVAYKAHNLGVVAFNSHSRN